MKSSAQPALTLILGGASSGKSRYAEAVAAQLGGPVVYLATGSPTDEEMQRRIAAHRQRRPSGWTTVEAQRDLAARLLVEAPDGAVVLDDVGMLVANLMAAVAAPDAQSEADTVLQVVQSELEALLALGRTLVVVSNEVGMGVVPPYPSGRVFRDVLGLANQWLAARAEVVALMLAGLPLLLKDGRGGEALRRLLLE